MWLFLLLAGLLGLACSESQLVFINTTDWRLARGALNLTTGPQGSPGAPGTCPAGTLNGNATAVVSNGTACGMQPALAFGGSAAFPTIDIGTVPSTNPTITLGSSSSSLALLLNGLPNQAPLGSLVPLVISTMTSQVFQGNVPSPRGMFMCVCDTQGNATEMIPLASGPVSASLQAGQPGYFVSAFGASSPVSTSSFTATTGATQFSWTCPSNGTVQQLHLTAAVTLTNGMAINDSLSLSWSMLVGSKPGTTPAPSAAPFETLDAIGSSCTSWIVVASPLAIIPGTQYIASCSDASHTGSCGAGDSITLQTAANFTGSGALNLTIAIGASAQFS